LEGKLEVKWILAAFHTGQVKVWDYDSNTLVTTIQICEMPTRAAKWIERKSWFIVGSDDSFLRIFDYGADVIHPVKIREWKAHADYIRSIELHPSLPLILSSSDDNTIKSWDWETGNEFPIIKSFEGHSHYVMTIKMNPHDDNSFASGSLDCSIKTWNVTTGEVQRILLGHSKGVNCVEYHPSNSLLLLSGADDFMIKLWDYQAQVCLHTLSGHEGNISAAIFHRSLPYIISTSEDSTVRVWHTESHALDAVVNPGFGRGWSLAISKNCVDTWATGHDFGMMVVSESELLIGIHESTKISGQDSSGSDSRPNINASGCCF